MRDYKANELYPHSKILSSTQVMDYEKDPPLFFERWELGIPMKQSKALIQGQVFSEMYADREYDYLTPLLEAKVPKRIIAQLKEALDIFPVLPKDQCEVEVYCDYKGWTFRATLDGYVESSYTIIENKTGCMPWSQQRFDESDQITFQAWTHWKKYGALPKKIICNWVDLRCNPEKLVSTWKTKRTITQLKQFEKRVDVIIANLEAGNFTRNLY